MLHPVQISNIKLEKLSFIILLNFFVYFLTNKMVSKLHFKAKIISLPYPIEMQFLIFVSGRSHDLILKSFLIP